MGLKQSIVVVNEFSTKTVNGGTRGGTPGDYVLRYMARVGAVEDVTPIRLEDQDAYITRYMARSEATEVYDSVGRIKQGMRDAQKMGGVAFGSTGKDDIGDMSMSHRKVKRVSKDIQKQFDDNKTVMKTILSFDLAYLKEMGIVEEDFEPKQKGDYRGNIDQMKLRLGIMEGMKKMSKNFDDLEWVGVIQVDTMHVHCHLCMVDKGRGRVLDNGQQRGKLNERDKRVLRRGVDMALDDMHPVKMLASNVTYDRRNARCFIKKYTHDVMAQNGTPQLLLACLPEDRRMWRANTHRNEMKKANAIVREYVDEVLKQPDSGYDKALKDIEEYAKSRQVREDLTGEEFRRLIHDGHERLVDDCINGVYSILRTIPKEEMNTRTPMLDVMSMEYTDMAGEVETDKMIEFGFKLRSYSSRLEHHKKERHKYRSARQEYEEAKQEGQTGIDSTPLYEYYKVEEEYNAMLMAKYQHFLKFLPPDDEYQNEFKNLMDYREKIYKLDTMIHDPSMKRRSEDSAEDYGRRVYDTHGGRYVAKDSKRLERRLDLMLANYDSQVEEFQLHLEDLGMTFESDEKGARVLPEPPYDFDTVKALDLHHLGYDFPYDAQISKPNVDLFVKMTERRYEAFQGAIAYLSTSGQSDYADQMPVRDVNLMKAMADRLSAGTPILPSMKSGNGGKSKKGKTVKLTEDFNNDIKLAIQATIQSVELGE